MEDFDIFQPIGYSVSVEEISNVNDETEPTSDVATESNLALTTKFRQPVTRGSLGIVMKNPEYMLSNDTSPILPSNLFKRCCLLWNFSKLCD